MRDSLFISHVTPKDNDFAKWLYIKLELAGYKTWIDIEKLYGGERDFWQPIEDEIKNNTVKFLLICSNQTFSADGVLDEYEFARSIAKEFDLSDFIIPIRIEDIAYHSRIGLNRYNVIDFVQSWLEGLQKLIRKLEKDHVPKHHSDDKIELNNLLESINSPDSGFITKKEKYYSNWWLINKLPEKIFLFKYYNDSQAEVIFKESEDFPTIRHGLYLISFEENVKTYSEIHNLEVIPITSIGISIEDIFTTYQSKSYPTRDDVEYLLKRLLNRTFHLLMKNKGIYWYEMANKRLCYYYPKNLIEKNKVTIQYPRYRKTKNLIGKYYNWNWHFGISNKAQLHPRLCFSLKSHILFSNDGFQIWDNDTKLHSARRSKGKKWFNEEWRDQLIAFINALKSDNHQIEIKLNQSFTLQMPLSTIPFISDTGYLQPDLKDRQDILYEIDDFETDDDIDQDFELI